jgi:cyclopropane fatty-acyl-phospholipid synthase-like methyltransferase
MKTHKRHFEFTYQTNSDVWTHIPYHADVFSLFPSLAKDSLVLDIGSGRGQWMMYLIERHFRVLGIDYVESVTAEFNNQIKSLEMEKRGRALPADVLELPFTDHSFKLVTDIGTLQHIPKEQWDDYAGEIARVCESRGYYINVSLSSETRSLLGMTPDQKMTSSHEKFGIDYHFFEKEHIKKLFAKSFKAKNQEIFTYPSPTDPNDSISLVCTLFKKST